MYNKTIACLIKYATRNILVTYDNSISTEMYGNIRISQQCYISDINI